MLKKYLLILVTTFAFSSLLADVCNPCNPCAPIPRGYRPYRAPSYNCYPSYNCNPCNSCYNMNCFQGCEIYGDWIFWKVRRCELDYAWDCIDDIVIKGKPHVVEPKYDSGFRVGFIFNCNCLDLGVRYTYYRTDEFDKVIDSDEHMTASRLHPAANAQVQKDGLELAQSKYDLDYDVIDLEVGRTWDNCGCGFRAFGGVRAAFIDQSLFTQYSEDKDDIDGDTSTSVDAANVRERVDLDAYGLYAGGEGHYTMCGCFGLFGRVSAGALLGEFERSVYEKRVDDNTVLVDAKDCCYRVVTTFEIGAGIEFNIDTCYCGNWGVQVGYEFHNYNNFSDFLQFAGEDDTGDYPAVTDRHAEDLGFDGLFVRLNIGF